jgi:multiple sugar transport system substrate-binding protein
MLGALPAAAGAAALVACGPQAAPAGRPATAKVAGSIEFWQWGKSYVEGFEQLVAEFTERHESAQVVHTQPPGYDDKIKVAIAAGSGGPDVYMMRGPNHKQWAHDGLAIDITSFVTRDRSAAADLKVMQPTFYDYYHYQGKLHGVPWDFSTISVAYNVDALEARGLRLPSELGTAWDWHTFIDYARKLTPGDGSRYGVDAQIGIETGYYNWVVANGGNLWSKDFSAPTVDTPEFAEAVEEYMAMGHRLKVSPPRDWRTEQTRGLPHAAHLLTNGLVAMQTVGDWYFRWFDKAATFRWDVAPVPYAPRTKKTASIANFRGLVIAPASQNRDLAWAWMAFLITRQVQDRVPDLFGEVPARLDSIDQVYLNPAKAPSPPSRRLLKHSINATEPIPGHPLVPWRDVNGTAGVIRDVYDGVRETKAVLAEVQAKLAALIAV